MFKKGFQAFFLFLFSNFSCQAAYSPLDSVPYALTDILPNIDQIALNRKNFDPFAQKQLGLFVQASKAHRFDEAYAAWFLVCSTFFDYQVLYSHIFTLSSDEQWQKCARDAVLQMQMDFAKRLQEKEIIATFAANALAAESLTPQQREITEKILKAEPNRYSKSLQNLRNYKRSNFAEQRFPENAYIPGDLLKALTANILCFAGDLCYFHGGTSPWPKRIDQIAAVIMNSDADLVCLQEVWDYEAMIALIERLKGKYCHFVYNAGNQFSTLDPEMLGYNSGVFIASRIPLQSVEFTPFYESTSGFRVGALRGAVSGVFNVGGSQWSFVGTHMQHGSDPKMGIIREEQMQQCIDLMQTNRERAFLLGDLNINAFTSEYENCALSKLFFVPYLKNQREITPANATCTDYFNDLVRAPLSERAQIKPTYELLDYCVGFKGTVASKPLSQEKVPLFSIDDPAAALSDHQGLLTVWKIAP